MKVLGQSKSAMIAALSFAVITMPVQAQESEQESKTGSRFTRDKFDRGRDVRQTLKYFGTCVASYKSDKIEAFLLNPKQATWVPIISSPNNETRCAMANMSAGFREYNGTVSEGWYLRRFKDGPPAQFTVGEQTPPSQAEALERMSGLEGEDLNDAVTDEFARCVAATAPVQIDAFLRSTVGSEEERTMIRNIVPHLGPCSFEGQNLKLDFESLRSMLAYALARRAVHLVNGNN